VISVEDANAIMVSVGSSDVCALSTVGLSYIPRVNMTSRPGLAFPVMFMLSANGLYHAVAKSSFISIIPSIVCTGLMTHFAFNAKEIVTESNIEPSDSRFYGLVQLYMKLGLWNSFKGFLKTETSSYHPIQ